MYRLMIVEDEPLIRDSLHHHFPWSAWGFEVAALASNGLEALQQQETLRCDAILLDIRMPVMDGIELMQRLHEREDRATKVVLSGYSDFQYAKKAIEFGCVDYVLKPLSEKDLERAFERVKRSIQAKSDQGLPEVLQSASKTQPAVNYILQCYDCQIAPEELAKMCNYSMAQFYRLFKEEHGMTVTEYVNMTRIEKAREMLKHKHLRIAEVSSAVGFTDPRYFARVFSKRVGMTPLEYRNHEKG